MAAFNRLNPQAPSYIPLSYIPLSCYNQTLFTSHFSFTPAPPPLSYFAVSKSPYPTPPPPPPHNLFPPTPPPPPPPVFEPTPPARAVTEAVRIVPPRRRPRVVPPSGRSGFNGRSSSGDQRRGLRSSAAAAQNHHQREPNFRRRFGISSSNGERRGGMLKKHDVLPLTPCEEKITTVMIKNIPKQYNGELLLKFLDEHCWLENQKRNQLQNSSQEDDDTVSAFDFMYLPVDFRTGCSRGFAFVNFTEARAVGKFLQACNRKPWDLFQSPKIREIVCAKIQGKEAQVKHFEKSIFRCESDEFLPVSFSPSRDGSGQVVEEIRIGKRIASTTSNA